MVYCALSSALAIGNEFFSHPTSIIAILFARLGNSYGVKFNGRLSQIQIYIIARIDVLRQVTHFESEVKIHIFEGDGSFDQK